LIHTGLRISEAMGLRWEHLADRGRTARQGPRTALQGPPHEAQEQKRQKQCAPLPRHDRKPPGAEARSLRRPNRPVFSSVTGTPLSPANVYRRVLAPAAIAVGFYVEIEVEAKDGSGQQTRKRSTVNFHPFRHTCASLLFDAGRYIKQVQEWLGHADPGSSSGRTST
jgi:integrase